ncbi:MAG: SbcC/MukB-like Walker B domain-containing protein, partial [Acidimicrobiia bacterium]
MQATDQRKLAEERRDDAHTALVRLLAAGLATDAGFDLEAQPATITASHQTAQQIRARFANLDRSPASISRALSRLEERVYQASGQLSGRADLSVSPDETGAFSSLTARVDGVALRAPVLEGTFADRLAQAESELSEREERIFEETLTGAVRDHLASRIRSATTTVRMVNQLLERIRTAAGGVKVQIRWDVDGDEVDDQVVLKRIKDLLLGSRRDPEEQADLHAFLRRQIDKVRASADDTGNWQDRLARVLDYRRWHRFTVLVHHDRFAEKPIPFGSRKVTLSAGEKTVALTVPLIAAIAAHYLPRDGEDTPACPRLLLMDELFPKVDRPNKRMLLRLINDLGLDVVFTSDKDWCDYDTLETIAIHVIHGHGENSST